MINILIIVTALVFSSFYLKYRQISSAISKIKEGCFITLPYHAFPKFFSLKERSFDLESIPTYFYILLFLHEDNKFLIHRGFNWAEVFRAIIDFASGKGVRGGSSLTQQVSKALFTRGEISLKRKVVETIGAIALERHLNKEEILYLYLNSLKLVSLVSGLPDILKYLLGKESLSDISIAESELVISLLPAPTSRISKLKKLGLLAYDFCYSYEKILVLIKFLNNQRIGEDSKGIHNYIHSIELELPDCDKNCAAYIAIDEEIKSIIKTTAILYHLQGFLNKISIGLLSRVSSEYLLLKWQLALLDLLRDFKIGHKYLSTLTNDDQQKIIQVARRNGLFCFMSKEKVKLNGLSLIEKAIEVENDNMNMKLDEHIQSLLTILCRDEFLVEDFSVPNLGRSIEQFFYIG